MKKMLPKLFTVMAAAMLALGMLAGTAFAQTHTFTADLDPLNGAEASGSATVTVSDGIVTVEITSDGMTPGLPHAQHFHIGGNNSCPPASASSAGQPYGEDFDNLTSIPEAAPFYGPIKVSLTTEGDTSPQSSLALKRMPTADDSGEINYERSFPLPDGVQPSDLDGAVIVQHGIGELDGEPNAYDDDTKSPFPPASDLPYDGVISALCGQLVAAGAPAGGVETGAGGTATTTNALPAAILALAGVALLGGFAARKRFTA